MSVRARVVHLLLVCALLVGAPATAFAGDLVLQDVDLSEYPQVGMSVALTADLVPASGDPVFVVLENGIEAADVTAHTLAEERPPVDVVLLLDESGSMEGAPLDAARAAAKSFVAAMRPEDRVAIVAFSSEPRVLIGFSSDVGALTRAIDLLQAGGETSLYDGLIRAAKTFEDTERDRFITVLSDGGDTTSINSLDTAAAEVQAAGAPVYAVALESPEYDPSGLAALASGSGGRLVSAADSGSLTAVFEGIAEELRNVYRVTFTSSRPSTKDLEIEVTASNGDVSGSLVTAVANPLHAEGELPPAKAGEQEGAPQLTMLALIGLLVLGAVTLGVWSVGSLLAPAPSALDQLSYYDQSQGDRETAPTDQQAVERPTSRGRVMSVVAYVSERRGFTGMVRQSLERAGLPLRANEYIFFHLLFVIVVGAVVQLLSGNFAATTLAVVLAVGGPIIWLELRVSSRRRAFEEQLPDVLSLLAGSLRAGWGIQQAIGLVVEEVPDPSASQFRRVESETRFGLRFEDALLRMAERVDSDDFSWTVAAIAIQREVGGNLAEVLDIVADTIRERGELKRHVSALTAESRFSAIALSIMPFFIIGAMSVVSPGYVGLLFASPVSVMAMAVGALLLVIGILWIIRLTKVNV